MLSLFMLLAGLTVGAVEQRILSEVPTFENLDELKSLNGYSLAIQKGEAGGIWIVQEGHAKDNGGTVVAIDDTHHWRRQADPSRLDVRWFGVKANGIDDDSRALQAAIDALPPTGGKLLLPSGRMRCESSLLINRSYVTIEGSNSGLLGKLFEAGSQIGQGSLLVFESKYGIILQPPPTPDGEDRTPRLGGITFREMGIAGTGKQDGQTGILVKRGENRRWGSVDGLLLERVYCIDLTWAADLNDADMTVVTHCWFSECGNGLRLTSCVYNLITNTCFADNDGIGVHIIKGKGMELGGNVFVRNNTGLIIERSLRTKIIGGTFETDNAGVPRNDHMLIHCIDSEEVIISSATFSSLEDGIGTAVYYTGEKPIIDSITLSGGVRYLSETF